MRVRVYLSEHGSFVFACTGQDGIEYKRIVSARAVLIAREDAPLEILYIQDFTPLASQEPAPTEQSDGPEGQLAGTPSKEPHYGNDTAKRLVDEEPGFSPGPSTVTEPKPPEQTVVERYGEPEPVPDPRSDDGELPPGPDGSAGQDRPFDPAD